MRFHLDEHVDHAIARGLRQRGSDVTTTTDAGLLGATDDQQLEFALQSGRVLFTQDADFLGLHLQGSAHAGLSARRDRVRGSRVSARGRGGAILVPLARWRGTTRHAWRRRIPVTRLASLRPDEKLGANGRQHPAAIEVDSGK